MSNHNKILIITTSHSHIDDDHTTGLWLEEFAAPFTAFRAKGYEVTAASIQGGRAPVDPRSQPTSEQTEKWSEAVRALDNTVALATVDPMDYDAVFLPGGHGTMFDFPNNSNLQGLLRAFAESDKVIAAVCHGPAGLVGPTLSDGTALVANRTITAFTDEEERAVELDGLMPFLLETRLRELGANFVAQPMWADHVEQDGGIITGQNPQSSDSVAQAVIKVLEGG